MSVSAENFNKTVVEMRSQGLPVSIFAVMMRVDREVAYTWLGGAPPSNDAIDRLDVILPLLRKAFGDNLQGARRLWKTADNNGSTLEFMLSAEVIDEEAMQGYFELLAPAIKKYNVPGSFIWR